MSFMSNTFIFNPKFTIYDNGQEICFFNSEDAKGTILRGIGVELYRHLKMGERKHILNIDISSLELHWEEETWNTFLDSLKDKEILIDNTTVSEKVSPNLQNVTLCLIGSPSMTFQMIELLKSLGFQNFIIETDEKFDIKNFSDVHIEYISSYKNISEKNINILIFIDEIANIKKARFLNEVAITNNIPFLCIRLFGTTFELGPLVLPGQSACFECYWQRLQSSSNNSDWYLEYLTENVHSLNSSEEILSQKIALHYLTMECLHFARQEQVPRSMGHVIFHDLFKGILRSSSVLEIPECNICKTAGGTLNEATVYEY